MHFSARIAGALREAFAPSGRARIALGPPPASRVIPQAELGLGLELDWACVTWDADMRFTPAGWQNWSFKGNKWLRILKDARKDYQKNAYRVLLTRARQGMVLVVPEGDGEDHTRLPAFYNSTYNYLQSIGFPII